LRNLDLNVDVSLYEDELGRPVQRMRIPSSAHGRGTKAYTFARPGYVVQVFANSNEAVMQWSVIACSQDFRPTFDNERWAPIGDATRGQLSIDRQPRRAVSLGTPR
jgi:hypothetical protein